MRLEGIWNEASVKRVVLERQEKTQQKKEGGENTRPGPNQLDG